jgi:hypothetical protein
MDTKNNIIRYIGACCIIVLLSGCSRKDSPSKMNIKSNESMYKYDKDYYPFCFPSIGLICPIPKIMDISINDYYNTGDMTGHSSKYIFRNYFPGMYKDVDKYIGNNTIEFSTLTVSVFKIIPVFEGKVTDSRRIIEGNFGKHSRDTCHFDSTEVFIVLDQFVSKKIDSIYSYSKVFAYAKINDSCAITFSYELATKDSLLLNRRKEQIKYMLTNMKKW